MERSEIGTLEKIPIWPANPSTGNRRRGPLKSRTVDTLFRILSICYADSSHITQNSDKSDTHIESVTKDDIILNDSVHQKETNVDELCNKHVEIVEQDHEISEERNNLSSFNLVTDKDVEEGEISGDFTNLVPEDDDDDVEFVDKIGSEHEDFVGIEQEFEKNNSLTLTPLSVNKVDDDICKDMGVVITKTKRNLVDYSEIALQSNLIKTAIKNQDLKSPIKDNSAQSNKKRQGSCTDEKGPNKKAKKSVDRSTCTENLTKIGENPKDASQEVIANANKEVDNEKKKKRGLTAERKAKKKRKERIKRAEKNRKLGVKRLKLQPVIKEKKITFCRHYLNGRCHEGENCKFSHDTIPLTKSKPCCHFARHSCMKGDGCPFDHQLSKYPCNNFISKGFCTRGSDCMFSHEAQPNDPSLNTPKESEQKPPNSSPKMQINNNESSPKLSIQPPKGVNFISREKIETKIVHTKLDLVMTTPKLSQQPPKGISFFSQPQEPQLSPKVNSEVKEAGEITKTPPVIPRGINFLSFGKKPGTDCSNGGFSLKIGKSSLSKTEGIIVNTDEGVKVDMQIGNKWTNSESSIDGQTSSRKSISVLPFLSSASQRTLQSTLAFAAKFDSGVKTSR